MRPPTSTASHLPLGDLVRRLKADLGASVAITSALAMTFLLGCAAVAIDMGSLYVERRRMQGAVDLAAMAAATNTARAQAAAEASLAANGLSGGSIVVEIGNYSPDPSLRPQQRFVSNALPSNAARVTYTRPGKTFFAKAFRSGSVDIAVTATAANGALASFSVGSRLVALRNGIVNQMLGSLFQGSVSLTAMDYDALAQANAGLVPLMNALATQVGIRAGTYNDVLASSVQAGQLIAALTTVAEGGGQTSAALTLRSLGGQINRSLSIPLRGLLSLGPLGTFSVGDAPQGFGANFKIMDILSASAIAANGRQQLSLNLAGSVPGVTSATLDLAIGESAQSSGWAMVGEPAASVSTTQTRLRLTLQVGGSGLLSGLTLTVPIYIDLARARARLVSIACATNGFGTVTVAATPGVAQLAIASTPSDLRDFSGSAPLSPATLLSTPLLRVKGSAYASVGNLTETNLSFSPSDISNGTLKRTDTRDLMRSLATTLSENLTLSAEVLGLSLLTPSDLTGAALRTLNPVLGALDDALYTILTTLGLHVGEADVVVQGVRCGGLGRLSG